MSERVWRRPIVVTRSVNGISHLLRVVYVLAFATEPMGVSQISRLSGVAKQEVRYLLRRLLEVGHVEVVGRRYLLRPEVFHTYGSVVFYRMDEDHVLVAYPSVAGVSKEEVLKAVLAEMPAAVRLWIIGVDGVRAGGGFSD